MQAQTIRPKHPSVTYLIIMLFSISAFIFTGCARHSGLSSGEVKNIQSNGQVIPLETRGPVQVSSSGEGSSVVKMENVTVPGMKETAPPLDYIVGPNDSILITVANAPEYSTAGTASVASQQRGSRVDGNGYVQVPNLGLVKVGGMTLPQVRDHIQNLLKSYMREPSVVVEIIEYGSSPLYLLGQFKNSGVFYMDRPFNVLHGIAMGGGYDESANPRSARVIRDNRVLPVDVYDLLMRADQSQNIWLKPGDTIFMPDNKDQRVFVFGAGKTGMSIPFPPRGLNLLEAIAIAGLQEIGYHSQNVHLIRSLSPTRGQLMVVDVDAIIDGEALPLQLCEGDVIYIPKSGMTSWNETIAELLPTLQAFGAILTPFVQLKYLFDDDNN
ncbi:MAG: polysaccharide biosynthesis/export family protein [Smithella sp.]|nr:polysaccharide biosynthesis/export family protein [Smithella sp.]